MVFHLKVSIPKTSMLLYACNPSGWSSCLVTIQHPTSRYTDLPVFASEGMCNSYGPEGVLCRQCCGAKTEPSQSLVVGKTLNTTSSRRRCVPRVSD